MYPSSFSTFANTSVPTPTKELNATETELYRKLVTVHSFFKNYNE
jgi:hypothetical protein